MEVIEVMMIIFMCLIIMLVSLITYIICKLKELEDYTLNLPDPHTVFTELMKTRIPILMDANGNPMLQNNMVKPTKNPLVG